ncbi:MAG: FecR domain-containing protein [Tannerella sp.]|jgi:ferric-dicitrate binding protein FerR (iron transport regulator)|nr:FecR domain-containing protein [Tannerella sp.]
MKEKNVSSLITKFFDGRASDGVRRRFGKWLIDDELHGEKQEAMYDVWENYTGLSDEYTKEDLKKIRKRIDRHEHGRRRTIFRRCAAAAAILLLFALSTVLTYRLAAGSGSDAAAKEPELVEFFVPRGERRHATLPDGSEVWINAGSLLVYEKSFAGATRTLYLNGEANFNVAHNPDKPFIVKTEYMDITALGTVFNIRSYPEASKSTAILESGTVRIDMKQHDMHSVVILSPNEQLVYDKNNDEFTTKKVEAAQRTQWTQGYMTFQSSSFDEVVQELERRFRITVVYDAARFRGRLFTLRFSPEEDVKQIFDILGEVGNFKYRIRENAVHVH